jgi:hypothetical protein
MKRTILVLMLLGLVSTACGSTRSNRRPSFSMQPITELAVGTLKLDGTAEAVTQEQAAELLPMWEVYKQIQSGETAAPQEIDGLSEQIRQTMTEAQQKSITAMKLTGRDVFAVLPQGQGPSSGPVTRTNGSSQQGGSRTNGNNSFVGGFPGGGFPGGEFPGGEFPGGAGGGGFGAGGGSSSATGTDRSSQSGSAAQNATRGLTQSSRPQVPAAVLDALIAYLKTKAGR